MRSSAALLFSGIGKARGGISAFPDLVSAANTVVTITKKFDDHSH
jgi:hypothetical protein